MMISEDSFTIEAGESETFTVTFSCDERTDASIEYEFTITATVTAWGRYPLKGHHFLKLQTTRDVTIKEYGFVNARCS